MREWRNWQTRTFEGRVVTPYGFKSRFSHQEKREVRKSVPLFSSYKANDLNPSNTKCWNGLRNIFFAIGEARRKLGSQVPFLAPRKERGTQKRASLFSLYKANDLNPSNTKCWNDKAVTQMHHCHVLQPILFSISEVSFAYFSLQRKAGHFFSGFLVPSGYSITVLSSIAPKDARISAIYSCRRAACSAFSSSVSGWIFDLRASSFMRSIFAFSISRTV